jgi:hypothetical protein
MEFQGKLKNKVHTVIMIHNFGILWFTMSQVYLNLSFNKILF